MTKYNIYLLILLLSNLTLKAQVSVKYLGYSYKKESLGNLYQLNFYIENNTKDTLFFSANDICFKVKNNDTILKNNFELSKWKNVLIQLPPQRREFISDNEKKYKAKKYKTAYNRAVKVVEKNNHLFKNYSELDKDIAANTIRNYIYVVPPNDFYVYRVNFDNVKLTRHSEVEVEYIKNDYFIGYKIEEYPEGKLKW